MNIISLGAGVQSSTMGEMANQGEITPMPDAAIFADTQAEPKAVYEWLDFLEKRWSFPIYRVSEGSLLEHIFSVGRIATPPFFTLVKGRKGPLHQECTGHFKLRPIRRFFKNRYGSGIMWLGISTDEASRVKDSDVGYIVNRYPLIEKRMNRNDCLRWMQRRGLPEPPKSACIFCPWTSDNRWRDRKLNHPADFARAVKIDKHIRHNLPGVKNPAFVHSSLIPLDKVDFSTDEDRGQLNMFNNECEGMCGV